LHGPEVFSQRPDLFDEIGRQRVELQSKEILDLRAEDQDCDAACETMVTG